MESGRKACGSRKVVVDAPVDHVHPLEAAGGAHVHEAVEDHQVAALHQLDAHLLGEEGVLEVGGVVDPRGEHHHGGIARVGAHLLQHGAQLRARVGRPPGAPATLLEHLREGALHHRRFSST
jgi:hypothetical protein